MYICLCKGITESDLHRAAPSGEIDPDALIKTLGLEDEDCCGRCVENIEELAALASEQCWECPFRAPRIPRLDTPSQAPR